MSDLISNDAAKQDKLFYIVSNVAIVNTKNSSVLILKRSKNEIVHPGKWALPGGKLEHQDVAKLLKESGNDPLYGIDDIMGLLAAREAKEECGLTINPKQTKIVSNKVFIRPDKVPVFMTIMSAKYSGRGVKIEEGAFSDYAWVNLKQIKQYDIIDGLEKDIKNAINSLT